MEVEFFGNSLLEWASAVFIALAVFIGLYFTQFLILKRLHGLATRIRLSWAGIVLETLQETKIIVLLFVALYVGSANLELPRTLEKLLHVATFILVCIQIGLWAGNALSRWSNHYRESQIKTNPGAVTTIGAIQLILGIVIWMSIALLVLDNLGFNVTTLVAGLGIGGVAVALALQGVLGDLFASLFIVIDRTFIVGDFLIVDDYLGSVEYIGWKTTRIRSLSGEQIVFSNSNLLNSRIRNYGRMYHRRVEVQFRVSPKTSRENLHLIPEMIKEAILSQESTVFDRAHFKSYTLADPLFEYVYSVSSGDFNLYMNIQQNINLILHERFEKAGIGLGRQAVQELTLDSAALNTIQTWVSDIKNARKE